MRGELRVEQEGREARISLWWPAQGGLASQGEVHLDAAALRRLIRALRNALWAVERAEAGR